MTGIPGIFRAHGFSTGWSRAETGWDLLQQFPGLLLEAISLCLYASVLFFCFITTPCRLHHHARRPQCAAVDVVSHSLLIHSFLPSLIKRVGIMCQTLRVKLQAEHGLTWNSRLGGETNTMGQICHSVNMHRGVVHSSKPREEAGENPLFKKEEEHVPSSEDSECRGASRMVCSGWSTGHVRRTVAWRPERSGGRPGRILNAGPRN